MMHINEIDSVTPSSQPWSTAIQVILLIMTKMQVMEMKAVMQSREARSKIKKEKTMAKIMPWTAVW